jgi:hypothetical protein
MATTLPGRGGDGTGPYIAPAERELRPACGQDVFKGRYYRRYGRAKAGWKGCARRDNAGKMA